MPLYEYECGRCGRFEIIRKFSDPALGACPTCGEPVQKLLSAPAFQFKGTGWYVTDYARKSSGGDAAGKAGDSPSGSGDGKAVSQDGSTASGDAKGTSKDGSATGSTPSK